jgi:hypothetical protein
MELVVAWKEASLAFTEASHWKHIADGFSYYLDMVRRRPFKLLSTRVQQLI